jgi:hypothetical protein
MQTTEELKSMRDDLLQELSDREEAIHTINKVIEESELIWKNSSM